MEDSPLFETPLPVSPLEKSGPGRPLSARLVVPSHTRPCTCQENSPLFSEPEKQGYSLYAWVSALSLVLSNLAQASGKSTVDASVVGILRIGL